MPDGLWLAGGQSSGEIKIWDPATGEELHKLSAHDNHIYTLDFGKDNRTLALAVPTSVTSGHSVLRS